MNTEPGLSEQLRQQVRGNLKSPAFVRESEALMMRAAFCLDDLEKQLAAAVQEAQEQDRIDTLDSIARFVNGPTDLTWREVIAGYDRALCLETQCEELRKQIVAAAQMERERCVKVCEAMVIDGGAWTHDQEVSAKTLFAAANKIRALAPHAGKEPSVSTAHKIRAETGLGPDTAASVAEAAWDQSKRVHADCINECQTAAAREPAYRCDGRQCDMLASGPAIRVPWKNPSLALTAGGVCGKCGFTYWAHRGHIIACPVCECERLRAVADAAKAYFNDYNDGAADRLHSAVRALERDEAKS
jgi:hypothetical protein